MLKRIQNKKVVYTAGVFFFALSIIFAVIFVWTIDVFTNYDYYTNFYGTGLQVVSDVNSTWEDFQVAYAILSILFSVIASTLTTIGIWMPDQSHSTQDARMK